jgi:hypothetical protein
MAWKELMLLLAVGMMKIAGTVVELMSLLLELLGWNVAQFVAVAALFRCWGCLLMILLGWKVVVRMGWIVWAEMLLVKLT